MPVEFYQLSSVGDRDINEDAMARILAEDYALCVVADGLGGHAHGELASNFFCQCLLQKATLYAARLAEAPIEVFNAWITEAVADMQPLFKDETIARAAYTTGAILYLTPHRVITAHCGDSRIYRLKPDAIVWRSRDHSLLQEMVNLGQLTEAETIDHPLQNRLTRSLNATKPPVFDLQLHPPPEVGETFVLCSDGFWEGMKAQEWLELSQPASGRRDIARLAHLMLLRANGQSDNVTVQWLRYL